MMVMMVKMRIVVMVLVVTFLLRTLVMRVGDLE